MDGATVQTSRIGMGHLYKVQQRKINEWKTVPINLRNKEDKESRIHLKDIS